MTRVQYKEYLVEITARSLCKKANIKHRQSEDCFRMSVPDGTSKSAILQLLK